jgi:predicted RecB family nuclease
MERKLSEIIRAEWIAFQWIETTQGGDEERMFLRHLRRTPDEAAQAQIDWDDTEEARREAVEE